MDNLIKNACWQSESDCKPTYFCGSDLITYDDFCLNGHRTSSLCMCGDCCEPVKFCYEPAVRVCGQCCLNWGCCIRAIEAGCVELVAEFYTGAGRLVQTARCPIAEHVSYQFCTLVGKFPIPCEAETVQLRIEFKGKITACTFFAPIAYFTC